MEKKTKHEENQCVHKKTDGQLQEQQKDVCILFGASHHGGADGDPLPGYAKL
jgi:hypothetical protein